MLDKELQKVYTAVEGYSQVVKSYFCNFSGDRTVSVNVKYLGNEPIAEVWGTTHYTIEGDSLLLTLAPLDKVVILPMSGTKERCLSISYDEIYTPTGNVITLPQGDYDSTNCPLITLDANGFDVMDNLADGTTLYLERGAVVHAGILLDNKHNVTICGEGIIDTLRYSYGAETGTFDNATFIAPLRNFTPPCVHIRDNCSDICIQGVTLNSYFRGVVIRNSEYITIHDIKVFTSCINADGINMANARHISIDHSLIMSEDDCIAVFTACDSILYLDDTTCANAIPLSTDIEVSSCLLITNARCYCIGGHSTGSLNPRNQVSHFYSHDTECHCSSVYDSKSEQNLTHARRWSGMIRIISQTEQLISDIKLERISLNQWSNYFGKPVHIDVRGNANASYTEKGGYRIENVSLKDIAFSNYLSDSLPIYIQSNATDRLDYGIYDVTLDNISWHDSKMPNESRYIDTSGNVVNLIVK